MPRFHFSVHDGADNPDWTGSDVIDFDDARRQALHMAGVLLQDQGNGHSLVSPLCVDIADEDGTVLLSVQIALVYRDHPERRISDGLLLT